jgi:hypothetical protein
MNCFDNWKIRFLNIDGGDMPDEKYFAIKGCTSISRLKLLHPLHGGSPQKYLEGCNFGFNPSLLVGTLTHLEILQPDDFIISDYEGKPSGKLGYFADKVAENRKNGMNIVDSIEKASIDADYYAGKLTTKRRNDAIQKSLDYYLKLRRGEFEPVNGKEVVVAPKGILDKAKNCINSVKNNYTIQKLLRQNLFEQKQFFNEIALFSNIEVTFPDGSKTIVPFKGKLDSVVYDPEKSILYLNDVKTTSKQIEYFMDYVYEGVGYEGVLSHSWYYGQLAAYQILLQKYFQEVLHITDYSLQTNFFVVETTGEHRSDVKRLNNSYIDTGIQEFKELICRLAWHQTYGFDKEFPESVQV